MKRAAFLITFLLLLAVPCLAQYDIHLKNGSVIKNVGDYAETDGQIMFQYIGGTVAIPMDEVDRIEEVRTGDRVFAPGEVGPPPARPPQAPARPPAPPPMKMPQETKHLEDRLVKIEERLKEIEVQEKAYKDAREEYNRVRLRIEVLFQKGIAEARRQGGDPAKWFEFLSPQERKWAQLNTLKKNKFEKELVKMEEDLEPLLQEKQVLLEEKATLEAKIKEFKSTF